MEWIDAHVHIGDDDDGISARKRDLEEFLDDGTLDGAVVFAFNEREGIPGGNERVLDAAGDDDRLAPLFRVDPAVHDPADLADAGEFAGFKLHPRSQDFELEAVGAHMDAMAATGRPVLIHTGIWRDHTHPRRVVEAVADVDTDVVLAHNLIGYYYNAPGEFRERLQGLEHVHVDLSIHCTPLGVEVLVRDLGPDRLLFASDYPYGHPAPMRENVELADVDGDAKEAIAGGTARRLFF